MPQIVSRGVKLHCKKNLGPEILKESSDLVQVKKVEI